MDVAVELQELGLNRHTRPGLIPAVISSRCDPAGKEQRVQPKVGIPVQKKMNVRAPLLKLFNYQEESEKDEGGEQRSHHHLKRTKASIFPQ